MAWGLLLTASVLLCLLPGADALRCRVCRSMHSGQPCLPPSVSCNADPPKEACLSLAISHGGQVEQKILGCIQAESPKCGLTWDDPHTGRHAEYRCCTSGDYCNE